MAGNRKAQRERSGQGATIGGAPANAALDALVSQFSERTSFVRELIQNSLDAGAGRIDVVVAQEKRALRVSVTDDGEGMDREIIEGYLLTLFRSAKENDLTKIGKFGVGFVSLFALDPDLVQVDTARDGIHHRVVFDTERNYTLAEVDEPFEGTSVTLWVRTWGKKAGALAQSIREAAHYWCRFARAEVTVEGQGASWRWPAESVEHPFTVDAPVVVEDVGDGFRAVLGFSTETPPLVGYYNRGLTLLEAREEIIPGVTFRVEAKALEHTLTRDNVIRDANYARVIARIRKVAETRLREAHMRALREMDPKANAENYRGLLLTAAATGMDLPTDLPILRTASGGRARLSDLELGLISAVRKTDMVLWATRASPLVEALEAGGKTVLLGPPDREPEVALTHRIHPSYDGDFDVHTLFILPTRADPHPLIAAAQATDQGVWDRAYTWHAGRLQHVPPDMANRLAILQENAFSLGTESTEGRQLIVNVDHPLFQRLAQRPVAIAAPILCWMTHREVGGPRLDLSAMTEILREATTGASA
jgi:molecular chaperone HtpG